MSNQEKDFVVTFKDGTEYFCKAEHKAAAAELAVRKCVAARPRGSDRYVEAKVSEQKIVNGEISLGFYSIFHVPSPIERMTGEDYDREMKEIVSDLPIEFAEFVQSKSWEDGHSAGYEEVINIATSLAYEIKRAVDKYNARIGIGN